MNSLEGRVCIVTGAGGGIGREHALLLAREGAKVVVNDVGAAEQVVDEIRAAGGEAVVSDESVTSWDGARRLVDTAVAEFGDLHVVVNNAGILRDRMLTSMEEDEFDAVVGVHLKGTFNVSRWAAVHWRDQAKGGEIRPRALINTTSEAGMYGNVGQSNYAAAKAGIAGMTLTHSLELKRYGVRVNAIAPFARTQMTQDLEGMGELFEKASYEASDVSPLVAVLAGEKCEFTGKVFSVFGRSVGVYTPWSLADEIRTEGAWDVDELTAAVEQLPQKIRVSRQSNLIAAELRNG